MSSKTQSSEKDDVRTSPPPSHGDWKAGHLVSQMSRFALNLQVLLGDRPESKLFALVWESQNL